MRAGAGDKIDGGTATPPASLTPTLRFRLRARLRAVRVGLLNDRWRDYAGTLRAALVAGYRVCPVRGALGSEKTLPERLLCLRHDVDHASPGTRRLLEVERKLGVGATYYFRWETLDVSLAQAIEAAGGEASLHYQTIADYARERDICGRATLERNGHLDACRERLREEVQRFRAITGLPARTIASHGDRLNAQLGVPNNVLVETPDAYSRLGIQAEAYAPALLGRFDQYVADLHILTNAGYRYGVSALELVRAGVPRILFLTHPNHWHHTRKERRDIVHAALRRGPLFRVERFGYAHRLRGRGALAPTAEHRRVEN